MRDWLWIKPSMRGIAETYAREHGLTLDDLKGPSARRHVAWPRQDAMSAMVATGRFTVSQVGRFFNRTFWTARASIIASEARRAPVRQEAA